MRIYTNVTYKIIHCLILNIKFGKIQLTSFAETVGNEKDEFIYFKDEIVLHLNGWYDHAWSSLDKGILITDAKSKIFALRETIHVYKIKPMNICSDDKKSDIIAKEVYSFLTT